MRYRPIIDVAPLSVDATSPQSEYALVLDVATLRITLVPAEQLHGGRFLLSWSSWCEALADMGHDEAVARLVAWMHGPGAAGLAAVVEDAAIRPTGRHGDRAWWAMNEAWAVAALEAVFDGWLSPFSGEGAKALPRSQSQLDAWVAYFGELLQVDRPGPLPGLTDEVQA